MTVPISVKTKLFTLLQRGRSARDRAFAVADFRDFRAEQVIGSQHAGPAVNPKAMKPLARDRR
jgi:hypothetical protein